jgi:hypothetical protein
LEYWGNGVLECWGNGVMVNQKLILKSKGIKTIKN